MNPCFTFVHYNLKKLNENKGKDKQMKQKWVVSGSRKKCTGGLPE